METARTSSGSRNADKNQLDSFTDMKTLEQIVPEIRNNSFKQIENTDYILFKAEFNTMIENQWIPEGNTILRTDKFTQQFRKE